MVGTDTPHRCAAASLPPSAWIDRPIVVLPFEHPGQDEQDSEDQHRDRYSSTWPRPSRRKLEPSGTLTLYWFEMMYTMPRTVLSVGERGNERVDAQPRDDDPVDQADQQPGHGSGKRG